MAACLSCQCFHLRLLQRAFFPSSFPSLFPSISPVPHARVVRTRSLPRPFAPIGPRNPRIDRLLEERTRTRSVISEIASALISSQKESRSANFSRWSRRKAISSARPIERPNEEEATALRSGSLPCERTSRARERGQAKPKPFSVFSVLTQPHPEPFLSCPLRPPSHPSVHPSSSSPPASPSHGISKPRRATDPDRIGKEGTNSHQRRDFPQSFETDDSRRPWASAHFALGTFLKTVVR